MLPGGKHRSYECGSDSDQRFMNKDVASEARVAVSPRWHPRMRGGQHAASHHDDDNADYWCGDGFPELSCAGPIRGMYPGPGMRARHASKL